MIVRCQPAHPEDRDLVLAWRNDPELWTKSGTGRPVSLAEHTRWWTQHAMDATRCRLWLIWVDKIVAGVIRFDRQGAVAEVTLYLAPPFRGRGVGRRAFQWAWAHRPSWAETARAVVRADNAGGDAFFRRLGFVDDGRRDACVLLAYR